MGAIRQSASLLVFSLLTSVAGAQTATDQSASRMMSDALANDARIRGRNSALPARLAAEEAEVLLQAAVRIDPQNTVAWRLLAEAAEANDHDELARESYKQVLKSDPQDLVSQVRFIELLAADRTVEQQIKLYKTALDKKTFDPQVRSEVAVLAAQLYQQRGEPAETRQLLLKAIELNHVNVRAWQAYCRLEPLPGELPTQRLRSLVSLLSANPYQPDAFLAGARLIAQLGAHDAAADWQMAGVEQYRIAGLTIPADIYIDLAIELFLAGRRNDAEPLITELLKIEDAPISAALLTLAIRQDSDAELLAKLRQRITESLPKDHAPAEERIAALTDALWAELAYFPEISDTVDARLEALKNLVKPDNTAYLRLFGWRLLRLGKYAEARKVLEPLVDMDTVSRLGVSRAALAEGDVNTANAQLQDLWRERPQGLLAVLATTEARKQNVKLPESSMITVVRTELARLPKGFLFAHRRPRDLVLISPEVSRRAYNTGDPIVVNLRMTNSSEHALAVGPGGAVSTSLVADATTRGVLNRSFMGFAVENTPRVYRLEKGDSLVIPLRIDQGALRQWLDSNPTFLTPISVSVTVNPVRTPDGVIAGLGGQTIFAADFDRIGFNFNSVEQVNKVAGNLDTYSISTKMLVAALLQATAPTLPDENPTTSSATTKPSITPVELKAKLVQQVTEQYKLGQPVMQAWLVRNAPAETVDSLQAIVDAQLVNPDAVVRMMAYGHLAATLGKTDKTAATKKLEELAEKETDALASQWAQLMIRELAVEPAATQNATTQENRR